MIPIAFGARNDAGVSITQEVVSFVRRTCWAKRFPADEPIGPRDQSTLRILSRVMCREVYNLNLTKMIEELRAERANVEQAITVLKRIGPPVLHFT